MLGAGDDPPMAPTEMLADSLPPTAMLSAGDDPPMAPTEIMADSLPPTAMLGTSDDPPSNVSVPAKSVAGARRIALFLVLGVGLVLLLVLLSGGQEESVEPAATVASPSAPPSAAPTAIESEPPVPKEVPRSPLEIAEEAAKAGDADAAFAALSDAQRELGPALWPAIERSEAWSALRADPRMAAYRPRKTPPPEDAGTVAPPTPAAAPAEEKVIERAERRPRPRERVRRTRTRPRTATQPKRITRVPDEVPPRRTKPSSSSSPGKIERLD